MNLQHYTRLYNTILHFTKYRDYTVYETIQDNTILYTTLYKTIQYYNKAIRHYPTLHNE